MVLHSSQILSPVAVDCRSPPGGGSTNLRSTADPPSLTSRRTTSQNRPHQLYILGFGNVAPLSPTGFKTSPNVNARAVRKIPRIQQLCDAERLDFSSRCRYVRIRQFVEFTRREINRARRDGVIAGRAWNFQERRRYFQISCASLVDFWKKRRYKVHLSVPSGPWNR